jgi:hypothetical protein
MPGNTSTSLMQKNTILKVSTKHAGEVHLRSQVLPSGLSAVSRNSTSKPISATTRKN